MTVDPDVGQPELEILDGLLEGDPQGVVAGLVV
jgi:hypothetical protein